MSESSLIAQLIAQYGYLAVFFGSVLEGETVLVAAGFAAHRGYLDPIWVFVVAALGGFAGDQVFFWIGRARGSQLLQRWPSLQPRARQVDALLQHHHAWIIVGIRFLYGLRVAGPVVLGMSTVSAWRFALFNAVGALLWAGLIGGAGYLLGNLLELVLQDVRRFEEWALLAILVAGLVVWIYRRVPGRRR